MLVLRDVHKNDLPGLKRLAAVLNTVNLPNNEETLEAIIDKSVKSFSDKVKDPFLIGAAAAVLVSLTSVGALYGWQTARERTLVDREQRAVQDSTPTPPRPGPRAPFPAHEGPKASHRRP